MKIKLTEEQYNRLLIEDSGDWGRLTDKVTPFIVKLFKLIENKLSPTSPLNIKIKFLRDTMALPINEALIVAYTYEQYYKDLARLIKEGKNFKRKPSEEVKAAAGDDPSEKGVKSARQWTKYEWEEFEI